MENLALDEGAQPAQSLTVPRLPFSFAKRFGIALDKRSTGFVAAHKEGLQPHIVSEVQRFFRLIFYSRSRQ